VLSTFYPGNADSFDGVFGVGYFPKKAPGRRNGADQIIVAPFGDHPRADIRYHEYKLG